MWSPTTSTLIHGERDAVLVDALMTKDESRALADWVVAAGKNVTAIFVTHAHGDHFFGAPAVLERFPDAKRGRAGRRGADGHPVRPAVRQVLGFALSRSDLRPARDCGTTD